MEGISAERAVLEGAVSPELAEAFRMLGDIDLGAGPKYPADTLRQLSRTVAARAYGKPMLELCHLLRIAEALGGRHGWPALFFGVPAARAAAFRGFVEAALKRSGEGRSDLLAGTEGVTLTYADRPFQVTYGRMGFLAALAELLVTAIGFRAIDAVARALAEQPLQASLAPAHANQLSRLFYDYLKDHLTAAQSLRVFAALVAFLEHRRGSDFSLDDIDDAAVFDYWSAAALGEVDGGELRGFRSVVERMSMLRSAIEAAVERHALGTPRVLGSDRSAGEVDPDAALAALEAHDDLADGIEAFRTPPIDRVKLLTGRELGDLGLIAALGRQAKMLPLSILRAETLGVAQNRVSQALRRHAREKDLSALIDLEGCEGYGDRLGRWRALEGRMDRMSLAGLGLLIEAGRAEAAAEILARVPSADLSRLRERLPQTAGENIVTLRPATRQRLVAALGDRELVGADVAALVDTARRALRGVSRSGFQADDRRDPAIGDGVSAGVPVLRRLRTVLLSILAAIEARIPDDRVADLFSTDRARFSAGLRQLYGVRP